MAHEVENMFYVNEVPWHGLGVPLDAPPTVEDAIRLAGLDWQVNCEEVFLANGTKIKNRHAIVRDSDSSVLGMVGNKWTPLQNDKAFSFFQPFLDAGECTLETAGSLRSGRHVFILAKIKGDPIEVVKGDAFHQFLLLANGHDGSLAASVALTPVRVVCANTLAVSLESADSKILRCIHSQQIEKNMEMVFETVNLARRRFEATAEQYKALARAKISEGELRAYVAKVFFPPLKNDRQKKAEIQAAEERAAGKLYDKIVPLFETGRGNNLKGVKGTYWGAYNALTEHLAYDRGKSQDIRTDSLWFGAGKFFNERALNIGLEMVQTK